MSTVRGLEERRQSAISLVAAFVLCVSMVFAFVMLRNSAYRSESALLKTSSEKIASQIAATLQTMLDTGAQFQTLLSSDAGRTYERLKSLAEERIASIPYIDSITIAPGAIIRYSFPEEKDSSSIGHDLLDNPERMQALVEAVRKKKAVLQGPSVSAEGKHLAFLRIPVLDKSDLWGFVSIGFDTESLLADFDLPSEFPGLFIAVASSGPDKRDRQVFWGDERALQGYAAPVKALAGEAEDFPWTVYTASTYPAVRIVRWGIGMLVLSLVSLGLFVLSTLRQQTRGKQGVRGGAQREGNRPEASFVVGPFVPKSDEEGLLSEVSEQKPSVQEPQRCLEETADEEPSSAASPATVDTTAKPAEVQGRSTEESERPISVLVVDDSEVNRELLLRMLALKGYDAEAVSSGLLALEALKERKFDVALIDCIMPEMDGYALASAVVGLFGQGDASLLGRPAMVAMSPRHDPEEVKKCADAGFDSLLIKPFTMTSLDQKIRQTLGHRI